MSSSLENGQQTIVVEGLRLLSRHFLPPDLEEVIGMVAAATGDEPHKLIAAIAQAIHEVVEGGTPPENVRVRLNTKTGRGFNIETLAVTNVTSISLEEETIPAS